MGEIASYHERDELSPFLWFLRNLHLVTSLWLSLLSSVWWFWPLIFIGFLVVLYCGINCNRLTMNAMMNIVLFWSLRTIVEWVLGFHGVCVSKFFSQHAIQDWVAIYFEVLNFAMTTSITLLLCLLTTTAKLLPWQKQSNILNNQSMSKECETLCRSCPWRPSQWKFVKMFYKTLRKVWIKEN
jgi:hypothetical protein